MEKFEPKYPGTIFWLVKKKQNFELFDHVAFSSRYSCGPTVYDSSHIGHASTYVTLDIIHRILKRVFNFNIVLMMGITDIDDKIIQRSEKVGQHWRLE